MVVNPCVSVKMESVMNKLTQDKLNNIFDGEKNLVNKPIFIDFYADW